MRDLGGAERVAALPAVTGGSLGSALASQDIADRRVRLRRLDDCLEILEQAHELDLTIVTDRLEELVGERVPAVRCGMLIADAIEEVLREQEPFMVQLRTEPVVGQRRSRRRREPFDIRLLLQRR